MKFAVGQTKSSPWRKYYGVGGTISIYNPKVVQGQYSSAEVILRGASDSIIAGLTVSNQLISLNFHGVYLSR